MTPEERRTAVFARLRQKDCRRAVFDFDNTLYLNNSTERFLDSLRPRWLAFVLSTLADWAAMAGAKAGWLRYDHWRDFLRVWVCAACMPWGLRRWRAIAGTFMQKEANLELLRALYPDQKIIVLSFGFRPIIAPLLAGITKELTSSPALVCSELRLGGANLRAQGKMGALRAVLPESETGGAVFVTDSEDDREMLDAFPESYLIQWRPYPPRAFHNLYFPLRYTAEGKYPGSKYVLNQILMEDLPLLLLAYAFSWWNGTALVLLFLSMYAVYEMGLFSNDHRAAPREKSPRLSERWQEFRDYPIRKAWPWAMLFAAGGLLCLTPSLPQTGFSPWAWNAGAWTAILLALYTVFGLFNRLPVQRRIWVFPALHTAKTFSFAALIPLTPLGILLLLAQIVSQSANYLLYRRGGDIRRFNRHAFRLFFFLLCVFITGAFYPAFWKETWRVQMLLILLWSAARALEHHLKMNFFRIMWRALRAPFAASRRQA